MWNVYSNEVRTVFRQRTYLFFLLLWTIVLSFLFLLQKNNPLVQEYTNITATISNVALYLIPLVMLLAGSFSLTNEVETGQWNLLKTYPISLVAYATGKLLGQFTAQVSIFSFSYGGSLLIAFISGIYISAKMIVILYLFCLLLIYFFLLIGIVIGCLVSTRWHALGVSVSVWFLFIMMWPTVLISTLGFFPYQWIEMILSLVIFVNPAELLRILFVINVNGGAVFGQTYDALFDFLQSTLGWAALGAYFIFYSMILVWFSVLLLHRRKKR